MKKHIALLLAVALLCLCCACGASGAPDTPAEDTRSAADVWEAMQEGIDTENMPSFEELNAESLENFYGLTDAELESFVCQFPMMNVIASEIFVGKCVSGQEAAVKAGVEKRHADLKETWGSYLPEQLALVEDARIVQNGVWTLFVVSDQADAIEAAFNEATK